MAFGVIQKKNPESYMPMFVFTFWQADVFFFPLRGPLKRGRDAQRQQSQPKLVDKEINFLNQKEKITKIKQQNLRPRSW